MFRTTLNIIIASTAHSTEIGAIDCHPTVTAPAESEFAECGTVSGSFHVAAAQWATREQRMITVISGTNRPDSNTIKIAKLAVDGLRRIGEEVELLDLTDLPLELFDGASYGEKPGAFAVFQDRIIATDGILTVIPEYNGACPGVMKYFIDMLRFPDSLYEKPAGFIGISAGPMGRRASRGTTRDGLSVPARPPLRPAGLHPQGRQGPGR